MNFAKSLYAHNKLVNPNFGSLVVFYRFKERMMAYLPNCATVMYDGGVISQVECDMEEFPDNVPNKVPQRNTGNVRSLLTLVRNTDGKE